MIDPGDDRNNPQHFPVEAFDTRGFRAPGERFRGVLGNVVLLLRRRWRRVVPCAGTFDSVFEHGAALPYRVAK